MMAKAAKNDLKAVLQVNPAQNGKHAFREKIRFTIHRESLELLVNNLTEENLTLKNVVEGVRTLVREEPVAASRSSHKLAAAYKRVQRHAQALYRAVSSVWIRSCHEKHKVLLHLDNLVPKKSFNPLLPQEEIIENVQFKMFFNEYGHSISPKLWHEASIQPIEAEDPSDAW